MASLAAISLLAFAAIDIAAQMLWKPDPYRSPNRSWVWWATRDLRAQDKTPDVAILGSSLMLAVLNDGDATYLNHPLDAVSHHRAYYLEHLLQDKLHRPVRTASLAIGGQMASDVYALTSTLLKEDYKPKLLIWGIAPRDLVDASFTDPRTSETVQYLDRLHSNHNALPVRKPFWSDVEDKLGSAVFLYGQRQSLWCLEQDAQRFLLDRLRGTTPPNEVQTAQAVLKEAMARLPEDCREGQWMVTPYSPDAKPFKDNSAEYKMRYQPFKPTIFNTQASYLDRLLAYCREQGISVALVNMPLTQNNLSLLPDGVYQHYLQTVQDTALKNGAQFIDFSQTGLFKPEEFADYVHLNGRGGMRFFDQFVTRVNLPQSLTSSASLQ